VRRTTGESLKMDVKKIYAYALQREYEGKRFFEQNAERLSHAAAWCIQTWL
jgi:hypothetical protein